jgi:hypothetical protein
MTTAGSTPAAPAVFEVRGLRWPGGSDAGDGTVPAERLAARYEAAGAAAALAAFAADRPDVCGPGVNRRGWRLTCVIPGQGDPPARRLMNWEKNPDAEVSDGWLSNIAAQANSLADRLEWEPRFCTRASWLTPCPACGQPLREQAGKWGGFYRCTACDWKAGVTTKKARAAEARATIAGWCGARLEVRYSHLGVPYPGCPACHPRYRHPTVSDIRYGTGRAS